MQENLGHIEGIGTPMKDCLFHITLAVLSIKEGELEHAMARTQKAIERFLDLLKGKHGYMMACFGTGFGDYGSFWQNISLGSELCCILREYLDYELEGFIADARFLSHLTIFKQNSMADEARFQLAESLQHFKTGSTVAQAITMRAKKDKLLGIQPDILLDVSLKSAE